MAIADQIASVFSGSNAAYLAELYAKWRQDANSVDPSFAQIFSAMNDDKTVVMDDVRGPSWAPRKPVKIELEPDDKPALTKEGKVTAKQLYQAANDSLRAVELINAYRSFGHFNAVLDPLSIHKPTECKELNPETYGFKKEDLDRPVFMGDVTKNFLPGEIHTLGEVIPVLRRIYCSSIAWEYTYLQNSEQQQWFREKVESQKNHVLNADDKKTILQELAEAVGFETFCQKRYVGVKRFGLDGGESLIPALRTLIRHAVANYDIQSVAMGMAHRGRLNVLTNIVGKSFPALFSEFAGKSYKSDDIPGVGDVKYHLGYRKQVQMNGQDVDLVLEFNPSHLEAADPVVEGRVRAMQDANGQKHLAVLMHGDAAFAGQGVVYETFAMSRLPGYKTNGTIHVVTNNQIGFTTSTEYGHSGYYCTDVAKVAKAPVIHVNGDDPEAVVSVMRLAVDYRERFATDIVVDIVCYRRFGHNETDEPTFTQPIMYQAVHKHKDIYQLYAAKLQDEGVISAVETEKYWSDFQNYLQKSYEEADNYHPGTPEWLKGDWKKMQWRGKNRKDFSTAVSIDDLKRIGKAISSYQTGFNCHPKLVRQLEAKAKMFETGKGFDWATGEALAFGSLLLEGHPVRLSGEDCQRGTFSHRNAMLFDQKTQQPYIPLNHIATDQAKLDIYNSLLSEFAVLGFEYGYSCENANALVLWEAQFGDFANGAQIIIDQFVSAAESKWLQQSGLVLLLPHAQEGQGAEHSSARLERYLQLCAEENMQVCNFTTPANYFHALRRQLKRNYRQPLVVMSPKSLLRHPLAQSTLAEFADKTEFLQVIDEIDASVNRQKVKRVVFCSGKVYYDLLIARREAKKNDVALVRVEQLYPFPIDIVKKLIQSYFGAQEFVWCQEEPQNMGAWQFISGKIEAIVQTVKNSPIKIEYAGRTAQASPAAGLMSVYKAGQEQLVKQALNL